ncbi:hypothetical protein BB560_002986 [Smittium megazygosporum]|uniref:Phosphatidate cytidylyltransferase n=1 Tax=Smittium megazygosporum TaxID=133381 RepID=A0A2T9ZDD1_9FUNG|nr:hypothetical protein BB560_002986 [Smittium megazygosporum]
MILALFASLIAPFGGFFASGVKRALKIKDFGDSIPGHGGLTDRFDCQFIMAAFSYMYYSTFIRNSMVSASKMMTTILSSLSVEDQVLLFTSLRDHLSQLNVSLPTPASNIIPSSG